MTIRGGGDPFVRLGPPPRSLAAEANGCFMVGSDADPTEYKVAGDLRAPKWRAPLGSYSASAIRKSRSHQRRSAGRNQLDIEIPIQVLAMYPGAIEGFNRPIAAHPGFARIDALLSDSTEKLLTPVLLVSEPPLK
jgi:hypothetical protein